MSFGTKTLFKIHSARVLTLMLTGLTMAGVAVSPAHASTGGKIRMLTVTGDEKSQEGYQDQWMAKPGQPNHKLYRGCLIAANSVTIQ